MLYLFTFPNLNISSEGLGGSLRGRVGIRSSRWDGFLDVVFPRTYGRIGLETRWLFRSCRAVYSHCNYGWFLLLLSLFASQGRANSATNAIWDRLVLRAPLRFSRVASANVWRNFIFLMRRFLHMFEINKGGKLFIDVGLVLVSIVDCRFSIFDSWQNFHKA